MRPIELWVRSRSILHKRDERGGVYLIYCHANEHGYIGSSRDVYSRTMRHRADLRNGVHPCKHMQSCWNSYGEQTFVFRRIEWANVPFSTEDLLDLENKWLLQCDRTLLFNTCIPAVLGGEPGHKASPEAIAKRTAKLLGSKRSEETRAHMRAAQKGLRVGRKHTEEHKRKIGDAQRGKKRSLEAIQKTALKNKEHALHIEYHGESLSIPQWEEKLGWPSGRLRDRLRAGWSIIEALTTAKRGRTSYWKGRHQTDSAREKISHSKSRQFEFCGESHTLREWAAIVGLPLGVLDVRVRRWGLERALTTPPRPKTKRFDSDRELL